MYVEAFGNENAGGGDGASACRRLDEGVLLVLRLFWRLGLGRFGFHGGVESFEVETGSLG